MTTTDRQAPVPDPHLVAYVVSDDGLFAARSLPLVRAAIGMGLSTAVITKVGDHRAEIEAAGARVVPLDLGSGVNPMKAGYASGQLSAVLKALNAELIHCTGLGAIVAGGTAAAMAGIGKRIYEPTALARPGGVAGRMTRKAFAVAIRGPLASRDTRYLFETAEDARALGFDAADIAVAIAGPDEAAATVAALYGELIGRES